MPQRQKQFDKNLKHNINKNYTAQQEYTRLADCLVSSITKKQKIDKKLRSKDTGIQMIQNQLFTKPPSASVYGR